MRLACLALLLASLAFIAVSGCTPSVDEDDASSGLSPADAPLDSPLEETLDSPLGAPLDGPPDAPLDEPVEEPPPKTPLAAPAADEMGAPANRISSQPGDILERPVADQSIELVDRPAGQPESGSPVVAAEGEVTLAPLEARTDLVPDLAPPNPEAEKELRHPLRQPSEEQSTGSNPLRPASSATTDTFSPRSPPVSETTSDPGQQARASGSIEEEQPFDPIKANGPIFEDWPKPKLALLISGRLDGYLEPCGCAGLDLMKGGLSRRHSLVKELRQKHGWEVIGLDVGGMVKGYGRQAELKFQITVNAFRQMEYRAIGLGKSDLKNRATELLSVVAGEESPFHSANVGVFGFDAGFTNTFKIVEARGLSFGITSILGASWQKQLNNSDIELADPEIKLARVLSRLKACDKLILLAHATKNESIALAKKFPDFDIVVTAGGAEEPPAKVAKLNEDTLLVEVGTKGTNVIVLGLFDDAATPYRYQRVPLDSRFADSADMRDLMMQYQAQLRDDGFAGLGIHKNPHHQSEVLGQFVGSAKCESCHEGSYKAWKKTGHAKAFEALVGAPVPRQFDPECISCHVVGWHPTKHYPYESGFWSREDTPHLEGVGCESCHGPGQKHADAEQGGDLALQEKLQKEITVTMKQARDSAVHACLNCHDGDNSPYFNFEEYWPRIEHHDD